jgi:glycosyltransferase involved in cell wall biosynthesis
MKILFITHNASRSGAPLVLFYFMKWLKENRKDVSMGVLFVTGGPLEQDFTAISDRIYYFSKKKKSKIKKGLEKFGIKFKDKNNWFGSIIEEKFDLIYANTIVSIPYAHKIKQKSKSASLLVHVHEMETIIKTLLPEFDSYIPSINHFIAVSIPVKKNLLENHAIPLDKIDLVYECSILSRVGAPGAKTGAFIVGASGLSHWRKGNDIFLQVARYVKKYYPLLDIKFHWVGNEYKDKHIIDSDIKKLGLQESVKFLGEVKNPFLKFNAFDIFLMISREDPFPLVCIEIAQLQKPIICFEGATGTAEIVAKGGGFVVPYLDVEAIAEKIIYYYHNSDAKRQHGYNAASLFSKFTPENICPQIFQAVQKTLDL